MRRSLVRARLRRTYAVLGCVLWLLGIEVLPNLHLALHDENRPHTHAADGTVITVSFDRDAHRHADGTVHSHARPGQARRALDAHPAKARHRGSRHELAIDEAPDAHLASGLAHRAAALQSAPPPSLDVVRVDHLEVASRYPRTGRLAVASIATRDARGPPRA